MLRYTYCTVPVLFAAKLLEMLCDHSCIRHYTKNPKRELPKVIHPPLPVRRQPPPNLLAAIRLFHVLGEQLLPCSRHYDLGTCVRKGQHVIQSHGHVLRNKNRHTNSKSHPAQSKYPAKNPIIFYQCTTITNFESPVRSTAIPA